jgi:hypothetical protein
VSGDDKRKQPRRGVTISHQPPKPTQLPSPWPAPMPAGHKEILDKLDKLAANQGRDNRRRKQQPKPKTKARVKSKAKAKPKARVKLKHQMIRAILARIYGDSNEYADVGTTTLRHQAAPHWNEECKKRDVTYTLPSLDTFDRAIGRRSDL